MSSVDWNLDQPWFGGFSGLEISSDGQSFAAMTDRSYMVRGRLERHAGILNNLGVTDHFPLLDTDGLPIRGNRSDSEGLALAADGQAFISFELLHRVFVFPHPEAVPDWAAHHDDFNLMPKNGSLEALAIDTQGRLFALPEVSPDGTDFPVYRYQRDGAGQFWDQPFRLPKRGSFAPVGADFGPDGRLYLLERRVYPLAFQSRVRAFDLDKGGHFNEETVLETAWGRHGNLEGIAVWQDQQGYIRLTMIADNNFLPLLSTHIVEYRLQE
jgi:hypothetical protein